MKFFGANLSQLVGTQTGAGALKFSRILRGVGVTGNFFQRLKLLAEALFVDCNNILLAQDVFELLSEVLTEVSEKKRKILKLKFFECLKTLTFPALIYQLATFRGASETFGSSWTYFEWRKGLKILEIQHFFSGQMHDTVLLTFLKSFLCV